MQVKGGGAETEFMTDIYWLSDLGQATSPPVHLPVSLFLKWDKYKSPPLWVVSRSETAGRSTECSVESGSEDWLVEPCRLPVCPLRYWGAGACVGTFTAMSCFISVLVKS